MTVTQPSDRSLPPESWDTPGTRVARNPTPVPTRLFAVPVRVSSTHKPSPTAESEPAPPGSGVPGPAPPVSASTIAAFNRLRDEVRQLALPLETPGAVEMRREREHVLRLLDDYLARRIEHRDGPMIVVIGGPTGAGKSTLLNSLLGARVSASGVLRPTTAEPVLVYNPVDGPAFFSRRLLPNLMPTTAGGRDHLNPDDDDESGATAMRLVPSEDLAPGLAIVDSPDLDSYRTANHDLAADLLDVADIWLHVTTGTDYANAVPWEFLRTAAGRRLGVATVLNRMRPDEIEIVGSDLTRLLGEHQLGDSPMFVVPEVSLNESKIPVRLIEPLWRWLTEASGSAERRDHLDRAVDGAIDEVLSAVDRLADAAADQVVADRRLRVDLEVSFRDARGALREGVVERQIDLTAAVDAWSSAELARPRRGDRLWRRFGSARPVDGSTHRGPVDALVATLSGFTRSEVQRAIARVGERWTIHPAARSIGLERILELPTSFDEHVDAAVRGWLDDVGAATYLPETSGQSGPVLPPGASFRMAAVALMPSPTGALADGLTPSKDLLNRLRENLVERLAEVAHVEEARLGSLIDAVSQSRSGALREAGAALREVRALDRAITGLIDS
jgi:energy-coupling factor transporter ATP-binding protein EcfA2